jgi:hypothetical protein
MHRIVLTRTLSTQLKRDTQETWNGVVATFPLTKRGVMKASRVLLETRKNDQMNWGTIGAGRLTLTLHGVDVTDHLSYLEDGSDAERLAAYLSKEIGVLA